MSALPARPSESIERLTLDEAATHLLNEARMVLPGIQALFGFQLIAVFSQGFRDRLSPGEQLLHLGATTLVVVAVALVMAPAALHCQLHVRAVTERFISLTSRLLLWSMVPLAVGIAVDLYLVARVIVGEAGPAVALAVAVLVVFLALWVGLPRWVRMTGE